MAGIARGGMEKSAEAFRTISEVAQDLDLPQHVLRFWESRFTQIRPLKRGGGRRYYRPEDIELLRAIRQLLYGEGYTIKGVQKILKDQGVRTVASSYGAPGGTFVPPAGGYGPEDFEELEEDSDLSGGATKGQFAERRGAARGPACRSPTALSCRNCRPNSPIACAFSMRPAAAERASKARVAAADCFLYKTGSRSVAQPG